MWLLIEPTDVWLFRDARPFTGGESFRATGVFPPLPPTVYGALRGALMAEKGISPAQYQVAVGNPSNPNPAEQELQELIRWIGTPDRPGELVLRGPFLAEREPEDSERWRIYLPAPLDLVIRGQDLGFLKLKEIPQDAQTNWPSDAQGFRLPWLKEPGGDAGGKWIRADGLKKYLQGQNPPGPLRSLDHFCKSETRVGLQISDRRTAEEGMLYMMHYARMEPGRALVVYVDGDGQSPPFSNEGTLLLGGESRTALYRKLSDDNLVAGEDKNLFQVSPSLQETRFKLVFLTPAPFRRGWIPDFITDDLNDWSGEIRDDQAGPSVRFRLVAASIGKPVPIGGWDMVNRRPRPLRRAVPAGSVYYFEILNAPSGTNPLKAIAERYHFRSVFEPQSEEAKKGLGVTVVGVWQEEDP